VNKYTSRRKRMTWTPDHSKRYPKNYRCQHRNGGGFCVYYGYMKCVEVPYDWDECLKEKEKCAAKK